MRTIIIYDKFKPTNEGEYKMESFNAQVDARKYEPKDKHPTIFKTFDNLKPGEIMELINDHDPRPFITSF